MPIINAAIVAADKTRKLGISDAQFAELLGIGKATLSRWIAGGVQLSYGQSMMLHDAVIDIEELFRKLHPIKPDLSDAENARTVLKLLREKKLWVVIRAMDYEQARHLTREEIERAKISFEAGVRTLAEASVENKED